MNSVVFISVLLYTIDKKGPVRSLAQGFYVQYEYMNVIHCYMEKKDERRKDIGFVNVMYGII